MKQRHNAHCSGSEHLLEGLGGPLISDIVNLSLVVISLFFFIPHTYTLGRLLSLPMKWVWQPLPWPSQGEVKVVEQAGLLPSSTL